MPDSAFDVRSEWVHISYSEASSMREVYGFTGMQGLIHLEGVRFMPADRPSKTLIMYMHPASTLQLLPVPRAMAAAGAHVLCAGSRYARNDTPLILENVIRDYAAYVRHAKEIWGYEKVVVAGWSGGGSLTAFYQAQAEQPSITQTAAGDPIDVSGFIPGDAIIFHAAHLSRAQVLADFIDPSVVHEDNPAIRSSELDLYDPRNPNKPPYSADYIAYFRSSQLARMRRRTVIVKELLHDLRSGRTKEAERGLLLHRTLAEPRFLDGTIDPNDRRIGWSFLGDPEMANSSPAGVARFSTLRAWLSQWSIDDTQAKALNNAPKINVPLLAIENSADDAVPQPHTQLFFEAAGSRDKRIAVIAGANHYYAGQPKELDDVVQLTTGWLRDRALLE
ncbi:serine aminopeptidase domain-containing protein [Sphingomonas sp. SRS2]|uniref:serine aminopeptidase domain-containing protein n=1 Tax=Sphingomonas sp. SRS2 TaxID=133190 RepID=UPI00061844DC|nr:alpha/beta fold hydrolase [Sphingomonas sp. SRS2]KKC24027.1 alpha/beta hydrolase [Sphingomonas sp. SRS2]